MGKVLVPLLLTVFLCLCSTLLGVLLAVDPKHYGAIDRIQFAHGVACKVYIRQDKEVWLCGKQLLLKDRAEE